ncbi:MAG: hypothetical protein CL610_30205 [Anaerolineaceae bacterium]|nr:hypothetical protein [Anaerolineaceae bacterium]
MKTDQAGTETQRRLHHQKNQTQQGEMRESVPVAPRPRPRNSVLKLQQQVGNQAVQRLFTNHRASYSTRHTSANGLPPVRGVTKPAGSSPLHADIIQSQDDQHTVARSPQEAVLDRYQREIQWGKSEDDTGAVIWRSKDGAIVGILEVENNQLLGEYIAGYVTAAELVAQGKAMWSPMSVGAEADVDTEVPGQGEEAAQDLADSAEQETDSSDEVTEEEGQGLGTVIADISTDFIPGVSNVKDATIALTGINPVTGEKVGWGWRIVSGIFAIPGLGNLAKYGVKGAKLLGQGLKFAGKGIIKGFKAIGRLGKKIGSTALRAGKKVGGKVKSAAKWLGRKLFGGTSIMDKVRDRVKAIEEAKRAKQIDKPATAADDVIGGTKPPDSRVPEAGGGGKEPPGQTPTEGGGSGGRPGGTGTVWDQVNPTGPMRPNTAIPQFFELQTSHGKFFVNTNGTKHMEELVVGKKFANTGTKVSHSAQMRSQAVLTSFAEAMEKAGKEGIRYGEIMNIGPWELIIEKTGKGGPLPVVKHAVYR